MNRELPANEVHLYFVRDNQILEPGLLSRYQAVLAKEELLEMSGFCSERHRHRYLVTRALIRSCLSRYYQIEPDQWRFDKNINGKPRLARKFESLSIQFSISHTRGLIVCGLVPDVAIGVDVEDGHRPAGAESEVAQKYFSPSELKQLAKLSPDEQKLRFFDYWTLKESYIKARGMEFPGALLDVNFIIENNRLLGFKVAGGSKDETQHWQFWRIFMWQQYQIAVAIKSPLHNYSVHAITTVPMATDEPAQLNFL